jgi:hypothetical protein
LVLDVRVDLERSIGALIVAYGTGVIDKEKHKTDLIVDDWAEVHALGLHKPTRFSLSLNSRMALPWSQDYFVPPAYVLNASVVLGSLTDEQIERLIECLRLQKLEPYAGTK